jgi:serine/threonine-protein kinase RsbW
MRIGFTVRLPVDAHSVPFIRGLCREALEYLRVDREVVGEITLALSKACANVVQHAGPYDGYEVAVDIDDDRCLISVIDDGAGFDLPADGPATPVDLLDGGSGLLLMRALVDELRFERDQQGRHRVVFTKRLGARTPEVAAQAWRSGIGA